MTWKNDWRKVILAEIKAGYYMSNTYFWSQCVAPNADVWWYGTDWLPGNAEPIGVNVDGVDLTKKTSIAACEATANTWYLDFFGQKLYARLTSGASPGHKELDNTQTYCVVGSFMFCFSNTQYADDDLIDFIPTDCTYPHYYEPWLMANSIAALSQSVADHYTGAMETSFGGISFLNNGWWYTNRKTYLWNNKELRIKVGSKGDAYAAFDTLFVGRIRNPKVSDANCTFDVTDSRIGLLRSIPPLRYDTVSYPNLATDAVDKPIPILFGQKTNITPVQVDTTTFKFKISQTVFDGVTYAINAIDAVYKDDVLLTLTTHYTVDLNNGEFTLAATCVPSSSKITCNAKGIKDAFNLTTGIKTGAYSENVADHLFFVLNVLNGILIPKFDLASFLQLQTVRTQKVAWYLDEDTDSMEFNRILQQTSIYHFIPYAIGTFAAKCYLKTVPAGTLALQNYDYDKVKMIEQSEGLYRNVVLKYDKNPSTGIWKTVSAVDATVAYKYDEKSLLEIETALRDATEAGSVLAFYKTLVGSPGDKIDFETNLASRNVIPTEKYYINRSVMPENDVEIPINVDDVYVILSTRKDLSAGVLGITAQLDTQLAIYTVHADSPHEDLHGDHSDTAHGDGSHSDTHTDDHYDTAHVDSYIDSAHIDTHYDTHTDHTDHGPHEDIHSDEHYDTAHVDTHSDSPYVDYYIDYAHEDSAHADHSDTAHTDTHTDESHIDSEL